MSERDRRCRVVKLTSKFSEVQRVMNDIRSYLDAQAARGFSEEEMSSLHNYLSRVYQNISES